ncbi:MAG: hypothetical protein E7470_08395 [Ruminococcaceae bacterium]|nr:hypothetical protein [Oscillospiraceae bacterium]
MKTNREMAESVLQKATQITAHRKLIRKRAAGILAGVLSVVLIVGLFMIPWGAEQPADPTLEQLNTSPTEPTQEDVTIFTGQVYFLSSTSESDMLKPMKTNMTYGVDHVIRVFPKADKAAADEFCNAWAAKYAGIVYEGRKVIYSSRKTIIYSLNAGVTSVILPDYTKISKVERDSDGVLICDGTYATFDRDYTIKCGEQAVTIPGGSYRVYLNLSPSQETIKLLENHPETPLSTLHDTITLTIHYTNGATEILKFNVSLDDEGHVYLSPCHSSTL